MDSLRHKTQKRHNYTPSQKIGNAEQLQIHLEQGAKNAYSRQWHRIERGLRLNRLRLFIEEIATDYAMNKEERDNLFLFLQKALDKKLLNTLKVVQYDLDTQRILSIKGLSIKRDEMDKLVFLLESTTTKGRADTTRKRKKEDIVSVSVPATPSTPAPATAILTTLDADTLDVKIELLEAEEKE